ncbi:MAG: thiolase family protein [Proteobacteria bacterium]|nr:thiolase family protein [Pseudomonadota bacterium]
MPDKQLRGRIAVAGVGNTAFGKLYGNDPYDLGARALKEALADAGLSRDDIDGLLVSRIPDYQRFGEMMGLNPRFAGITPGQGRMSGASIELAAMAIHCGMAKTVALVYGNNGRTAGDRYGGEGDRYGSGGAGPWFPYGMTSPGAVHAIMFQRHAHLYGTRSEQLAHIAVAFRRHAGLNPSAVMRDPITVADHQASRYICEPLHLLDYCLINDGGVAIVLTSAERARDLRKPPVYIRGFAQATRLSESYVPPDDFWRAPLEAVAGDVYAMAGAGRDDMDALMIYDNFSPTVLFSLEGFGFCPVGEGGRFVEGGRLELGGRLPTNTSGGHLSESYMQGWALNVEAVRQIRGECGARQVTDAGLVQYICAAPLVTSIIYGKEPS